MANRLSPILNTPVSSKILEKLNDKEMMLIEMKLRNLKYFTGELDKEDEEEYNDNISVIKSVLNNGKSRINKKTYYGTGQYNKLKNI